MSLSLLKPTEWEFVTAGGAEFTIGAGKFLFGGAQAGAFYVRNSTGGPIYRLPYAGAVGGAGIGLSVAGPVSVSASLPFAPGGGWTIYRNPVRRDPLKIQDFAGAFVAWSGSVSGGIASRSLTLVVFGAPLAMASSLVTMQFPVLVATCEGAGLLWGSSVQSSGGGSAEVITGLILPESLAGLAETGN